MTMARAQARGSSPWVATGMTMHDHWPAAAPATAQPSSRVPSTQ
eukprot:CAMPEP_0119526360 /NCGR_PEP_ID=MMETSP1344-20130328/40990_1 /TAXON_ID=236787 /ORGANISM="Florenciella parvula, Strain CCMP2471" /LENGTH=43 /DNA_ID= /DNA_START= /DNA_END= /DNA_ORIENTATION=